MLKRISIVIPVYNSKECLAPLFVRLKNVCKRNHIIPYFTIVNDKSTDGSREELSRLKNIFANVDVIHHDKNLGQMCSIATGLASATQDTTVVIDGDLEHPPEIIAEFLTLLTGDTSCIIGVTDHSVQRSLMRNILSLLLAKCDHYIRGSSITHRLTTYTLLTKESRETYLRSEYSGLLFVRALEVLIDNSRIRYVPFIPEQRPFGKSAYSVLALARFGRVILTKLYFIKRKSYSLNG
jgi:glycosyltransferase involved in cell wall biosynthesis